MGLTRTRFSQSNTAIARIQDPITVLNNESTVANLDVGFLINRNQGIKSNAAIFWSESGSEFVTALTSATGIPDSNISVSSYANLRVGSLFGNIAGGNNAANVYITGSILPTANISYDLGSNTNRFKTLWLSGNTIVMGKESLTVNNNGEWIFSSGANTITIGTLTNFQGDGATVGNLTVTGNLNLQGSSTTFDSNNLSIQDSIIELHTLANLAPLTGDDGRDIGFKFHYYKTQDEHAFLGLSNDSGYLEWYDSGREGVGNVFSGNTYGTIKSGGAYFVNTTPSTSTTTGALRVAGGVGIAGNLYVNNIGDVSANIGIIKTNFNTLDANVASFQIFANANAASQQSSISTLLSNAVTQQVSIDNLNANIGSYQLFANANAATQSTDILNLVTSANANTSAYLNTFTGNISTGNLIASSNVYGSLVPTTIYKDFYIGTSSIPLSRGSGALTVNDFNTTGYAAQANLATLATTATKTAITSNTSAGTTYITYVSASSGNLDQQISTALIFNPATGNLRTYTAFIDTDLVVGGNLTVQNISYTNQEIITTTEIAQGNLVANSGVESTSNVTGALVVNGGIGAKGNVFANVFYTTNGIRWAGNGAVFASGGGGGGGTLTASNTAPVSPSASDFWYYVAGDILFQYINDGDSNQWVDISSPVAPTSTVVSSLVLANVSISSVYNLNTTLTALGLGTAANLTIGNVITGIVTATGNVNAANLTTSGNLVSGNINTGIITTTGNVNAANLTTSGNLVSGNIITGIVTASGNVNAANLTTVGNLVSGNINTSIITATGNVRAANLTTAGNVSTSFVIATGNVQGAYMLGDGSKLTNTVTTGKAIAMSIVFGG